MRMECLGLFDPGSYCGWDGFHGKDHSGELLVESQQELVNEGDFVGDPCSGREVLKVGDILLEPVISDSIRAFKRPLSELGEFEMSGSFGIEREEGGVEIFNEFLEGFLGGGNGGVG